jgi:NAD-dependent dihydropyrimidine dehydrogenase PreA subunit
LPVYVITDPCLDVKDKSCVEVCPVDCIHTDDEDRICYIDPDTCTGCHACLPACPVGAIFTEDDMPAAARPYVEVNALWYHDRDAARAKLAELA